MGSRRRSSGRCPRLGFTLIEMLVVISIIGILIAVLLPAVQSAREAARRSQCTNNLKQLCLASAHYAETLGVYPMSAYWKTDPTGATVASTSFGFLVHLLPFMEQGRTYASFNCSLAFGNLENTTVHGIGISALWCPSDGTVSSPVSTTAPLFQALKANAVPFNTHFSSYGASVGTWFQAVPYPWVDVTSWGGIPNPRYAPAIGILNGIMHHESHVRPANITDGLSNTMAIGERGHGLSSPKVQATWHWWVSGLRTEVTTLYPMNPMRKQGSFKPPGLGSSAEGGSTTSYLVAASSFHPGGCNFGFADGSVRFIKDTVDSWANDPGRLGLPAGVDWDPISGLYILTPQARLGVYQALSTRAGGEVIGDIDR